MRNRGLLMAPDNKINELFCLLCDNLKNKHYFCIQKKTYAIWLKVIIEKS